MVKANDSWLFSPHSPWQLPNVNHTTASPDPAPLQCLPACTSSSTHMISANIAMPGFSVPSIPSLKTQQSNEAYGLSQCLPPCFQNFLPAANPNHKENLSAFSFGLGGQSAPNSIPGCQRRFPQCLSPCFQNLLPATNPNHKENLSAFSFGLGEQSVPNSIPGCQRRFIVFDHSRNETRLIYSSLDPCVPKPTTADAKPCPGNLNCNEYAAKINQAKLNLHEVSDENCLSGEESEMHEDSEEINALLYSDNDDDDYDDEDGEEVRSTGHSPTVIKNYGTREHVEEITEEVASSDGPSKRQKLMDGGYKKSSPVDDTVGSVKVEGFHGYDDDAESSYAIGQNQQDEMVSILGNRQLRKDKIRATLKILESIIPGVKDKNPLLILDEAVDYLKSLKLKAKTLGVSYY